MSQEPAGTPIVHNGRLGQIVSADRYAGCDGYQVLFPGEYKRFAQTVTPAVVGETVCPTPRGGCWCGLTHVTREELAELTGAADS